MHRILFCTFLCFFFLPSVLYAQAGVAAQQPAADNIYAIKQQFLYHVLHNPTETEGDDDNELARFNRWFHDVEVRTFPSGNLPSPGVILTATAQAQTLRNKPAARTTSAIGPWQPVGPMTIPLYNDGIGRINCIVISPQDTNTLYVGAACGGVFISHNGGSTWTSNTDNFPSLSIADIAVNPNHTDTIYAATGDGYGYEDNSYNIFWGGLYSAGVMMSADGGSTWQTTGLSLVQSDRDIIQRLLINPNHPNILLAATRNGILQTTDAGATWTTVDTGHVYSMAFKPTSADTVYAINNFDLRVSYNGGATWQTLYAGLNPAADRCTIAVSPVSPNAIWVLDANNNLQWSHNGGLTFTPTPTPPDSTANFYGYYDRVLSISPVDSNYVLAFGMRMGLSTDGGSSWVLLNDTFPVHVDNHAATFNPLNPSTIYSGNDGGIAVTHDGGITWTNLANGMMISQLYRLSTSQQSPYIMLCGLQDNGSISYDSVNWTSVTGGDGEACAIDPQNDQLQITSYQNGNFFISYDQGINFNPITVTATQTGAWTAPVAFDPNNQENIYFGYNDIFASYDDGVTFTNLTGTAPFSSMGGATLLAVAPSNSSVIYAGDYNDIICSTDGGTTWNDVTGNLPVSYVALTGIAVDRRNPRLIYVTTSGYVSGDKVYVSTTGGNTWTNISGDLPNIPADCIAVDSSTPGAIFVGMDIGVYYTDSTLTGWVPYSTGLPNVIANDLEINYANYKVRVATYGRGVWECNLKYVPTGVPKFAAAAKAGVRAFPNPTTDNWKLMFSNGTPADYTVKVTDISGRTVTTLTNPSQIDASAFASGLYNLEVSVGANCYDIKAVKK